MPRSRKAPPSSRSSQRSQLQDRSRKTSIEPARPSFSVSREERAALERAIEAVVPGEAQARAVEQHLSYLAELHSWNVRGNLVAASDAPRLVRRHVVESLASIPLLDSLGGTDLIDLGSGGGLPGIPIKLVRPQLSVALVESRRLKSLFLDRVCRKLKLERIWVWQKRGEHLGQLPSADAESRLDDLASHTSELEGPRFRPQVDLLTSRAVAPLAEAAAISAPLVRPRGHLVTFKGSRLEDELRAWKRTPGPWEIAETIREAAPGVQFLVLRRLEGP